MARGGPRFPKTEMKIALPLLTDDDLREAEARTERELGRKVSLKRNSDHGGVSKRGMGDRWTNGVLGSLGETAFKRFTNLKTTADSAEPVGHDMMYRGHKLEVRATEWDNGHLLVYKKDLDDPNKLALLATGKFPQLFYRGAIRVGDAQRDEWWRPDADPPCWWVPQAALQTVGDVLKEDSPPPSEPIARAPDLQEWVVRYGGYWLIPWGEWDAEVAQWRDGRLRALAEDKADARSCRN